MIQLSQLGFWMFSGTLGAVGVAASVGVLDQPPRNASIAKTALIGEPISGGNAAKKLVAKKLAKLISKPETAAVIPTVITPKVIVPKFGLLRVEEDGSTLIAGNAEPGSIIEIFDGVDIVATTKAASNGDFVALLDKPLSPGDHQLGIRATGKDSQIQVSAETGLVSMPIKKDGQLLAMVMKPGEAIRLIQKPEAVIPVVPAKIAKVEPKVTAKKPAPQIAKPVEVAKKASNVVVAKADLEALKAAAPDMPEKISKPTKIEIAKVAPEKIEPQQVDVAEVKKPTAEKNSQNPTIMEPVSEPTVEAAAKAIVETVENSSLVATTKALEEAVAKASVAKAAKVPAETATIANKVVSKDLKEDVQIASKPVEETMSAPVNRAVAMMEQEKPVIEKPLEKLNVGIAPNIAVKKPVVENVPEIVREKPKPVERPPTIIVEAVEIDGPRMYIAGAAEPGRRVAIYVDNKFIGFADGSREGRFLLEVERTLAKGEHVVRADIYDVKGVIVAARAEVPLIHEPEEPAVVVAKVEPVAKPAKVKPVAKPAKVAELTLKMEKPKSADKTVIEAKVAAVKKPKSEPEQVIVAAVETKKKPIEPDKTLEPITKVEPDKTPGPKAVVEKKQPTKNNKPAEVAMATPTMSKAEQPEKVLPQKKPVETKVTAKIPVEIVKPAEAKVEIETAAVMSAPAKIEAPKKMPVIVEPKAQAEVKVASVAVKTAPAPRRVLRTGSSVIIRRGDSLWRISYRTYGRGIRYSTIYKANLQQLRSPHKIYPGQILKVPKKKFSEQG